MAMHQTIFTVATALVCAGIAVHILSSGQEQEVKPAEAVSIPTSPDAAPTEFAVSTPQEIVVDDPLPEPVIEVRDTPAADGKFTYHQGGREHILFTSDDDTRVHRVEDSNHWAVSLLEEDTNGQISLIEVLDNGGQLETVTQDGEEVFRSDTAADGSKIMFDARTDIISYEERAPNSAVTYREIELPDGSVEESSYSQDEFGYSYSIKENAAGKVVSRSDSYGGNGHFVWLDDDDNPKLEIWSNMDGSYEVEHQDDGIKVESFSSTEYGNIKRVTNTDDTVDVTLTAYDREAEQWYEVDMPLEDFWPSDGCVPTAQITAAIKDRLELYVPIICLD